MLVNWTTRPKQAARTLVDRIVAPYLDALANAGATPHGNELSSHEITDEMPVATEAPPSFVMTDAFHAAVHELRTLELAAMPKGSRRALSVGAQGTWYFEWFQKNYGELDQHIGIEAFEAVPDDLPGYVTWISDTADRMDHVATASVDLVYAGQTSEHLWAHELVGYLCEAHRVLTPGGYAVLDSPNRLVTEHLHWSHGGHTIELSSDEIGRLLDLAGFDVESTTGIWSCIDSGRRLGLEEGLENASVLIQRALNGRAHPDESFIWWVTARRRDETPDRSALEAEVDRLFVQHWPTRVSRGFFPGPGQDLPLSAGQTGRLATTLPFPLHAGEWEIAITLRSGDWASIVDATVIIEAPDENLIHHLPISSAVIDGARASWSVNQPWLLFALTIVLCGAVNDDVVVAFPIEASTISPQIGADGDSNEPNAVSTSATIADFVASFDAQELTLAEANRRSYTSPPPEPSVLADPVSPAYHDWVMATWREVTGRTSYSAASDESFAVDPSVFLARPYPYNTGNAQEIAKYAGSVAWTIGQLDLAVGTTVVEYGSGWGHLALQLAMSGCNVTAVDLNLESVNLLRRRADAWNVPLCVDHGGFLNYSGGPTDVAIFFEAFHHCDRPFELLDRVVATLSPNGRLVFIAEAVYDAYPVPWGVRLDGNAAFMARHAGWLELGFDRTFFLDQLTARGLTVTEHVRPDLGAYGTMIIATRSA